MDPQLTFLDLIASQLALSKYLPIMIKSNSRDSLRQDMAGFQKKAASRELIELSLIQL